MSGFLDGILKWHPPLQVIKISRRLTYIYLKYTCCCSVNFYLQKIWIANFCNTIATGWQRLFVCLWKVSKLPVVWITDTYCTPQANLFEWPSIAVKVNMERYVIGFFHLNRSMHPLIFYAGKIWKLHLAFISPEWWLYHIGFESSSR